MDNLDVNLARRTRSDDLIFIAQFFAGAMLAWGVAYLWLATTLPLIVAATVALLVNVIAWRRRGRVRGVWLTALGLFSVLSKVDVDLSTVALGDLRFAVIVGGSLVALAYGIFIEQRERFRAVFSLSGR